MGVIVFIAVILISLALIILINSYISRQFAFAAAEKGYAEKKYYWCCFLLGMIGYLMVIALPDHGNTQKSVADELPEL